MRLFWIPASPTRSTHPTMTLSIATTLRLPDAAMRLLSEIGTVRGPDDWRDQISTADALISIVSTRIDDGFLQEAPQLKIVAHAGVGYDNIDVDACRRRGIVESRKGTSRTSIPAPAAACTTRDLAYNNGSH